MPTVKDKITGKVISRQPYNQKGIDNAAVIADSKPEWEVTNVQDRTDDSWDAYEDVYKTGGKIPESNAMNRSVTTALEAQKKVKKAPEGPPIKKGYKKAPEGPPIKKKKKK